MVERFVPITLGLHCRRCGHSWVIISETPVDWNKIGESNKKCPKCNSGEIDLVVGLPYGGG